MSSHHCLLTSGTFLYIILLSKCSTKLLTWELFDSSFVSLSPTRVRQANVWLASCSPPDKACIETQWNHIQKSCLLLGSVWKKTPGVAVGEGWGHYTSRYCWSGPPAGLHDFRSIQEGLPSCNKSPDLIPGQCCASGEDKKGTLHSKVLLRSLRLGCFLSRIFYLW